MSINHSLPLVPGLHTQEAVDKIKRDSSQEAYPSAEVPSRSTIFRASKLKGKKDKRELKYPSSND